MRPSHPVSLELGFLSYTPVISNIGLVTQPQVLLLSMVLKHHRASWGQVEKTCGQHGTGHILASHGTNGMQNGHTFFAT